MQGSFTGWILLDEISMCCLPLLAALDQLRLGDCKICTFGDWDQLPPHPDSNSWRGCSVSPWAFKESRLYKSWSDCTCFRLTRCRRSDQAHFDFYTGLPQHLHKAISQSKKRYRDTDDADLHICISHKRRRAINSYTQEKHHKVCNVLKYQLEMIHRSNVLSGLDWWVVQQPANLSTAGNAL